MCVYIYSKVCSDDVFVTRTRYTKERWHFISFHFIMLGRKKGREGGRAVGTSCGPRGTMCVNGWIDGHGRCAAGLNEGSWMGSCENVQDQLGFL